MNSLFGRIRGYRSIRGIRRIIAYIPTCDKGDPDAV